MRRGPFTIIDSGRVSKVDATLSHDTVCLSFNALKTALGWEHKLEGLCKGDVCVPVSEEVDVVSDDGVDLVAFAELITRPLAFDSEERVAYLGESVADQSALLASLQAPDFTLPDLDGTLHSLSDYRGKKVLLVAYASWCGCREDLPVWQKMHEELKDYGFTVISVALDKAAEDVRPYIEKAKPQHPSLLDPEHRVAHLYGIINVSTVIWIDEEGLIVRPNAIEYGSDLFKEFHGQEAAPHLDALRTWVKEGKLPAGPDEVRAQQMLPTADEQLARAEFSLAWHLHKAGKTEAAERHFERAGELSPFDWTIRRGSMPIRGIDPMGPEFFGIFEEWKAAGKPTYRTRAVGNPRL